MRAILGLVAAAVIAAAAYFGLTAAGIIGGPTTLADAEITAGLEAYAADINDEDGLRFDDFSRLASATVVEKQATIRGNSLLNMADLSAGYLESRETQALNKLCSDEALRPLLDSGARFVFNWFSADDSSIGMVTLNGSPTFCTDAGY